MAANKNKIVALAQRYTVKGQFEKAIAEYRKLLKTDPQDIRTWLKVGDLYTRMGARKEATETYIRVAEQYTHAGFHLKAIAVYKQVLNIDPTLVVIHQYLAASYLELGLTSEALIQLEQLADVYERTQRNDLLLEVLLQMGKIDPHNIAVRLRIAELLSKENRVMEASKHFAHACDELKSQGRKEDFIKVAERLLYHDPSRVDTALEVAAMYVDQGRFKEALSKLQVCFVKNRKNVTVLQLLAKAFLGLGQPEKAISVMIETAEILAGQGDTAKRKAVFQEILAIDPTNESALAGLGIKSSPGIGSNGQSINHAILGDDIDIINEPSSSGIELIVDVNAQESLSREEIALQSQERVGEVRVLLKYGLKERALEHLTKVFEIDPYNIDGRELARDILLSLDRRDEALSHLFLLAEVFKSSQPEGSIYYLHEILKADKNSQRAKQMIRDLGGIMPEGMEDSRVTTVGGDDEPVLLDEDEDYVLVDDDDLHQADAVMENEELDSDLEDWDLASEPPATAPEGRLDSITPNPHQASKPAFVRDHTVVEVVDYIEDPVELSEDDDLDGDINIEDDDDLGDEEEVQDEFDPVRDSVPDIEAANLKQSTPPQAAVEPDESVEHEATVEPEIPVKKEAVPKSKPPIAEKKILQPPAVAADKEKPDSDDEPLVEIDDDLEEVAFFLEQELFDEAESALKELQSKYPKDKRIRALVAKLKEFVVPSEEKEQADNKQAATLLQVAADSAPAPSGSPSGAKVTAGGVQFKNVEMKEELSDSDAATTWDLGFAYKEMGLFEDAVQAFQITSRDPKRAASAKTMIGVCYVSLSKMDEAVRTFNEGLTVSNLADNEKMGLLYELGKTFQIMKKDNEARDCFEQICKIDDKFADAASRLRALSNTGSASKRK